MAALALALGSCFAVLGCRTSSAPQRIPEGEQLGDPFGELEVLVVRLGQDVDRLDAHLTQTEARLTLGLSEVERAVDARGGPGFVEELAQRLAEKTGENLIDLLFETGTEGASRVTGIAQRLAETAAESILESLFGGDRNDEAIARSIRELGPLLAELAKRDHDDEAVRARLSGLEASVGSLVTTTASLEISARETMRGTDLRLDRLTGMLEALPTAGTLDEALWGLEDRLRSDSSEHEDAGIDRSLTDHLAAFLSWEGAHFFIVPTLFAIIAFLLPYCWAPLWFWPLVLWDRSCRKTWEVTWEDGGGAVQRTYGRLFDRWPGHGLVWSRRQFLRVWPRGESRLLIPADRVLSIRRIPLAAMRR